MPRICPRCHSELKEQQKKGVTLDVCERCRGLWFDANEIDAVTGAKGLTDWLRSVARGAPQPVCPWCQTPQTRHGAACERCGGAVGALCPVCQVWMPAFEVRGVTVDFCVRCSGLWLDANELEQLQAGRSPACNVERPQRDSSAAAFAPTMQLSPASGGAGVSSTAPVSWTTPAGQQGDTPQGPHVLQSGSPPSSGSPDLLPPTPRARRPRYHVPVPKGASEAQSRPGQPPSAPPQTQPPQYQPTPGQAPPARPQAGPPPQYPPSQYPPPQYPPPQYSYQTPGHGSYPQGQYGPPQPQPAPQGPYTPQGY